MTPEQLRILNNARRKRGAPLVGDDALTTFQKEDEVTPYTTGLPTGVKKSDVFANLKNQKSAMAKKYATADEVDNEAAGDTSDFEKHFQDELNWVSQSTQYLFDAVDAAKEAASNASTAYDAAQQAQADANAAGQAAIDAANDAKDALNQALAAAGLAETADGTAAEAIAEAGQAITDAYNAQQTANNNQIAINNQQAQINQNIIDTQTALTNANTANTNAINALNQSGLTGSMTKTLVNDGTITINIAAKPQDRYVSILPVMAAGSAGTGGGDTANCHVILYYNGQPVFDKSGRSQLNGSMTVIGSWFGTIPANQPASVGAYVHADGSYGTSISDLTVLCTNVSGDFS